MKSYYTIAFTLLVGFGITLSSGCRKDPKPPATTENEYYTFANADLIPGMQRLSMLTQMVNYIKTAHKTGSAPQLSAIKLKDMYANTGNPFDTSWLNASGVQLKDQTSPAYYFSTILDMAFEQLETASINAAAKPSETTAKEGFAGKMINGTRYILVDSNGREFKELTEKGIMGTVFYYRAMENLNKILTFDNITLVNGSTAREKAWDEAFSYFGVPKDFPTNTTGLKHWGSYCHSVSTALGGSTSLDQTIMSAFVQGRKAIVAKDEQALTAKRDIIAMNWEKVAAGKLIAYLKGAKTNLASQADFHHNMSEAVGFIEAFRYNPAKTISDADINLLLSYFSTNSQINLYQIQSSDIDMAIAKVAAIFSLDATKL